MPANLREFLPDLPEEERMRLYGDIMRVLSYPRGHPVREGVILGMHLVVHHCSKLKLKSVWLRSQRTMRQCE